MNRKHKIKKNNFEKDIGDGADSNDCPRSNVTAIGIFFCLRSKIHLWDST